MQFSDCERSKQSDFILLNALGFFVNENAKKIKKIIKKVLTFNNNNDII